MLAARRPLPLVLNGELFGVWFFKINLTVGQFWAPKGGPGADNMHNKIHDLGTRPDRRVLPRFAPILRRRELPVLPYLPVRISRMTLVASKLPQMIMIYHYHTSADPNLNFLHDLRRFRLLEPLEHGAFRAFRPILRRRELPARPYLHAHPQDDGRS